MLYPPLLLRASMPTQHICGSNSAKSSYVLVSTLITMDPNSKFSNSLPLIISAIFKHRSSTRYSYASARKYSYSRLTIKFTQLALSLYILEFKYMKGGGEDYTSKNGEQ
jgi:hypothetical protein